MQKKGSSINLLSNQKGKTVDRVINWSLTTGRILVVVVELIALAAFLYRFTLDQQIIDTKQGIKQKQAIVFNFKDQEAKFRNLQERLLLASSFSQTSATNVNIFKDVVAFTPQGVTYNVLAVSAGQIRIDANVDSVNSLTSLANQLRKYAPVESVSIDKIENKSSSSSLTVSITATLKGAPNAGK